MTVSEAERNSEIAFEVFREAVREELERKRRLGQHYVVWREGKVVRVREPWPGDGSEPVEEVVG